MNFLLEQLAMVAQKEIKKIAEDLELLPKTKPRRKLKQRKSRKEKKGHGVPVRTKPKKHIKKASKKKIPKKKRRR